jgi:hypothetical protein
MPDTQPAAWRVVLLGLWVLVSLFVFLDNPTGTYDITLAVSGSVVLVIAAVMTGKTGDEQQVISTCSVDGRIGVLPRTARHWYLSRSW